MSKGWIGVDFDGTLAHYEGWKGPEHLGEPVPAMVNRVKDWLEQGITVRVFTARVSHDGTAERQQQAAVSTLLIQAWCLKHIGSVLPITNEKDYQMWELWDDRAVQVVKNTGERVKRGPSS